MFNNIRYGIDTSSGMIWSRVGSQVAIPILQPENMTSKNSFKPVFELDVFELDELAGSLSLIKWTQKIPNKIKNYHRDYWGMPPVGE